MFVVRERVEQTWSLVWGTVTIEVAGTASDGQSLGRPGERHLRARRGCPGWAAATWARSSHPAYGNPVAGPPAALRAAAARGGAAGLLGAARAGRGLTLPTAQRPMPFPGSDRLSASAASTAARMTARACSTSGTAAASASAASRSLRVVGGRPLRDQHTHRPVDHGDPFEAPDPGRRSRRAGALAELEPVERERPGRGRGRRRDRRTRRAASRRRSP